MWSFSVLTEIGSSFVNCRVLVFSQNAKGKRSCAIHRIQLYTFVSFLRKNVVIVELADDLASSTVSPWSLVMWSNRLFHPFPCFLVFPHRHLHSQLSCLTKYFSTRSLLEIDIGESLTKTSCLASVRISDTTREDGEKRLDDAARRRDGL